MIIDAQISILVGETTTIEIRDKDAAIRFVRVTLSPEQLAKTLGRLLHVACEAEIQGLDVIGKVQEHKTLTFPVCHRSEIGYGPNRETLAQQQSVKYVPDGWVADNWYTSQDSFSYRDDGMVWAKTVVRRWVDRDEMKESAQ